ncbi:sigma 54-interacting transcriptional regulator [Cobetia sp. 10Alg 146]|uniref:sigma-54 interaction domain-containing protein n=1 Tax=Cobetia sp. 10Alg 146 TaxID=3040019 RepID=UPI00244A49AB|nr:sigma 54-interacting transcriptional regulator [Cobetia sp. 10Alg 146]MDH2290086.1 sigma 54-interacting transcriptional regulator [Cobetia sp. 10Alg 146]
MQNVEQDLKLEAALALLERQSLEAVEVIDTRGEVIGVLTRQEVESAAERKERLARSNQRTLAAGPDGPPDTATDLLAEVPVQRVLDALHDGVYITDALGVTVAINQAYERITGLKRSDVLGRHMQELVRRGYISKSVSLEVIRDGKPVTLVQSLHDGRKILVSGLPMHARDGALSHVVTSVRDITELLRAKHAQEQLRQLHSLHETYSVNAGTDEQALELVTSEATAACFALAERVAATDVKVLIQGETGTGKTLLARYLHEHSERSAGVFLELNCAALPEGLLEAELFGYAPGAFTGANARGKQGLLDVANGGTLFLDEIGDLPLSLQAKLLKVVEEQRFMPVGGTELRRTNVRLLTASHHDLAARVREGRFREDLYYRLSVVPITLPPLRERRGEVIPLLRHYLGHFCQRHARVRHFDPEVLELLASHQWPGNIRELINLVERLVVTTDQTLITTDMLPAECLGPGGLAAPSAAATIPAGVREHHATLTQCTQALERELIHRALERHVTTRAAASSLGINQSTLVKKMQKYAIRRQQ